MRNFARVIALSLVTVPSAATAVSDTLAVDDASRLQWSIYASRVWFRNLNELDSSWQGCCYHYYIDLTTDEGKAMFSAFLTKSASRQPLKLWVTDKTVLPSRIEQVGNWQ